MPCSAEKDVSGAKVAGSIFAHPVIHICVLNYGPRGKGVLVSPRVSHGTVRVLVRRVGDVLDKLPTPGGIVRDKVVVVALDSERCSASIGCFYVSDYLLSVVYSPCECGIRDFHVVNPSKDIRLIKVGYTTHVLDGFIICIVLSKCCLRKTESLVGIR